MLFAAGLVYTVVGFAAGGGGTGCDSIQPGHVALSSNYVQAYTVVRNLVLTRADSAVPFGSQTETLTTRMLNGRPTLLDVLVFDTPRGKRVDSSWVDLPTFGRPVPSEGKPAALDQRLSVRPFEWNTLGLAVGALPLRAGYCAELPVYSDRFGQVTWYRVEVLRKTTVPRKSRSREPVWEILARAPAPAPSARYWVSQRHRVVSRVLVREPGVSIMYARD